MNNMLEELWYGNLCPMEQSTADNKEIKSLINLMGKNRENLSSTLNNKQNEILEKYDACINELHSISEREIFSHGFILGGRLMLETLCYKSRE